MIQHLGLPLSDKGPGSLFMVCTGEPRIEPLRTLDWLTATLSVSASELALSLDGLTWTNTVTITGDGLAYIRFTPAPITFDEIRTRALNVTYNAGAGTQTLNVILEALCLYKSPPESHWVFNCLESLPQAYRDASSVIQAIAKVWAWATFPLTVLSLRRDVFSDPNLIPARKLPELTALLGLPSLEAFPIATQRLMCEKAGQYYATGGSTDQIVAMMTLFAGVAPTVTGVGAHVIAFTVPTPPTNPNEFQVHARHWMPAWIDWVLTNGIFHNGAATHNGARIRDGVFVRGGRN